MRINGYEPSYTEAGAKTEDMMVLRVKVTHVFYCGCIGLVIALWIFSAIRVPTPAFPFDDSYIALHSAEVLKSGEDANFVGTPALSGVTSIAHVVLVSVLLNAFQPLMALQVSQWLAALAYILGLGRLAFVNGANWVQASMLVLAGAFIANVPHHLFNGLETGLALAGLTWALAIASDPKLRLKRWVPLLYAQLPFLRPEMALIVVLLLGLRFWQRRRETPNLRSQLGAAGLDVALVILGATPWLLEYFVSTGSPYPTTIEAKQNFFAESCWPLDAKWELAARHFVSLGAAFGLLCLGLAFMFLTPLGRLGLIFAVGFAVAYVIRFPDAVGQYQLRYMHILVPFLLFGLASSFLHRVRGVRIAGTVLLALVAVQSVFTLPASWNLRRACNNFTVTELEGVANWTRMNLPPDAILLVHDVGYISFATKFRLFDLVGLKTPEFLPLHRIETASTCGAGRGDALNRIAQFIHPNYIIVSDGWDDTFRFTEALRHFGWQLEPLRPATSDGKPPVYQVYRLTLPTTKVSARLH